MNRRVAGCAAVVFGAVASLIAGAVGAPSKDAVANDAPVALTPGAVPPGPVSAQNTPDAPKNPGAQPPAWTDPKSDAKDAPSAARGKEALLSRNFIPPVIARSDYDNLWKAWGLKARPADFEQQVFDRYGLHAAPYENGGLPMGLRPAASRSGRAGVAVDCMLCHGGSIFGTSYVGLPNTTIDLDGLFRDMAEVEPGPDFLPYRFSNVRGTTEATAAAHFLIKFRDDDLNMRLLPVVDLGPTPDRLCEDAPAWWLLKRKRTMYHNGQIDSRAVRPLMTFLLGPSATPATFRKEEPTFRDIQAYLLSLEPPKYPLAVDAALAEKGRGVFAENCAKCHGTYESGNRSYPNKVIPLEKIGTDPTLVQALTPKVEEHFRKSWLSREPGPDGKPYPLRYNEGYQAPPLDGVWATAPYLHNGSVPTLWHLLKSGDRPKVFTRSYRTGKDDYDLERVGWKVTELKEPPTGVSKADARRVYDTSKVGRSNAGHTYGDDLTDDERRAVIEYLKTL